MLLLIFHSKISSPERIFSSQAVHTFALISRASFAFNHRRRRFILRLLLQDQRWWENSLQFFSLKGNFLQFPLKSSQLLDFHSIKVSPIRIQFWILSHFYQDKICQPLSTRNFQKVSKWSSYRNWVRGEGGSGTTSVDISFENHFLAWINLLNFEGDSLSFTRTLPDLSLATFSPLYFTPVGRSEMI